MSVAKPPADLRVLIVDDTPANIDVLAAILEPEGYQLLFATSGEKALQVCARQRPDVVLLDVMMPGMDGFETCRRLCAQLGQPPVPILFVTARDDTADLVMGLEAGAVDYITKPIRREEVCARVKTHSYNSYLLHQLNELYREQKEQTESIRVLLNNIAQAVFMLDGDGLLQMINPAAERLLDAEPGRMQGTPLRDWLVPESAALLQKKLELWRGLSGELISFGPQAVQLLRRDGGIHEVDLSLSGMAVSRPLFIGIMHDLEGHKRVTHELRRLLRLDPLTQLANRRAFDEVLQREWMRSLQQQKPLSLIMIDIDHFKAYNDYFGHQQGDHCLRQVALCIARVAHSPSLLAARYGGEEFALILPDMSQAQAVQMAQDLLQDVLAQRLPHPQSAASAHVSLSVGVAANRYAGGQSEDALAADLLRRADAALYSAKRAGRNRYHLAE